MSLSGETWDQSEAVIASGRAAVREKDERGVREKEAKRLSKLFI